MSIPQGTLEVVVSDHRCLAPGIHQLELAPAAAEPLPPAPPGAHLDIVLPDSQVRQYSLLDDGATGRYRIAVQRERESRGGSAFLAERAWAGTRLKVSPPHSHFHLDESARHSVLIAGGIGVTPLVAMARRLARLTGEVKMHYLVRHREQAAFLDELRSVLPEGALHLHVSSQSGRVDLGALMGQVHPDKRVYACGPHALLNAVEQVAQGWPPGTLRLERFRNQATKASMALDECRVELQRSGHYFTLQAGESLLEALEREGFSPPSLCQEGICGTCAIPVIAGEVAHRDALQSADEKAANDIIYACVSRPTGSTLVLDL